MSQLSSAIKETEAAVERASEIGAGFKLDLIYNFDFRASRALAISIALNHFPAACAKREPNEKPYAARSHTKGRRRVCSAIE